MAQLANPHEEPKFIVQQGTPQENGTPTWERVGPIYHGLPDAMAAVGAQTDGLWRIVWRQVVLQTA